MKMLNLIQRLFYYIYKLEKFNFGGSSSGFLAWTTLSIFLWINVMSLMKVLFLIIGVNGMGSGVVLFSCATVFAYNYAYFMHGGRYKRIIEKFDNTNSNGIFLIFIKYFLYGMLSLLLFGFVMLISK